MLAHIEGVQWGRSHKRTDEYPPDSDVVARVLFASVVYADLYPTLSKTDDAKTVYVEFKRQQTELLAAILNERMGPA